MRQYVYVFLASAALGYLLVQSQIWPLMVVAGYIPALALGRNYLWTSLASLFGGIAVSAFELLYYTAMGGPALELAHYVGAVAGVPWQVFPAVTIMLSGFYCVVGGILGIYTRRAVT